MAGAIVIAVLLVTFPLLVAFGGLILSALLGGVVDHDVNTRFEGTELGELSR
jgi:hypothetical protein